MRSAKTIGILSFMVLVLVVWMWRDPVFRKPGEQELTEYLAEKPLTMEGLSKPLGEALDSDLIDRIRDHWGYTFPASQKIDIATSSLQRRASRLNLGVDQYEAGKLTSALASWRFAYRAYPSTCTGNNQNESDAIPTEIEDELALYGLYRYNRAVSLLEMASSYRRGDAKIAANLCLALYDLRRATGAFETLATEYTAPAGEKGGRDPYWGGLQAWEGGELLPEHSALPIHHVYANLAAAYLRIDESQSYPQVFKSYMRKEAGKYADSQSELSAAVSILTQSCLDDKNLGRTKYRLTMALQNLEAASRGMSRAGDARFNYMTGLILSHLHQVDATVPPDDAVKFLNLAARSLENPDWQAVFAAQKELALIYLELANDARLIEVLAAIKPGAVEDGLSGPDRSYALLFTDIAQYASLARGDLSMVAEHLASRLEGFRQRGVDEDSEQHHHAITEVMLRSFFKDLVKRFGKLSDQGREADVCRWIQDLEKGDLFAGDSVLEDAWAAHGYPAVKYRYSIGLWLHHQPGRLTFMRWLPFLLVLVLAGYLYWCFRSHQRVARQMLRSGYQNDAA